MKVYVKGVSQKANKSDVIHELSIYGSISGGELNNNGHGFVEFVNENDAKSCIADALFVKPMCKGKEFIVSKNEKKKTKKRKNYASFDDVKFTLSSLEMGNWGGQSSIMSPNEKGKKNENEINSFPKSFTFLSEWKYPHYEKPVTICFSKAEKAYILEGLGSSSEEEKRVRISYRTLIENSHGIFLDERDGVISLYITLKQPPCLYRTIKARWVRTDDWTPTGIFGRCLVYKLTFRVGIDLIELRDEIANLKLIKPPKSQSIVRCIDKQVYPKEYFERLICRLPFRLYYKLECLVSYGILTLYELEENQLGERLESLISGTYEIEKNKLDQRLGELVNGENDEKQKLEAIAWYTLNQISIKNWNPFDVKYQDRPISIFDVAIKNFRGEFNVWHPSNPNLHLKNNSRCTWINHATITPTKIYFDDPSYEPSNRILRSYEEKSDHFLRVTFKEENFDRLFVNKDNDSDIIKRIAAIMKNGFYLAGRYYEFLAFSSSQLREQSCWFVASDGDFNANNIRAKMGILSHIKAPALYAARMGQCFTSTMGTLKLNPDQIKYIEEIRRNGFDFSDGCGTISPSLAVRAAKEHWGTKNPDDDEVPSVFQIRFGGCKGMVAVDPDLKGDVLCIRRSQRKFNAPDSSILEIVKTVKTPLSGYLNRQIILLLSTLKVPDHVFISLQEEMCRDINSIMINENKAREIAKRNVGTRETSHIKRTIISMIDAGMMKDDTIDPFLKAILECKRVYTLKSLRHKARILMPNSFLLLGVIDETGILKEGEIYIQTSTIISEHQTFEAVHNKIQRKRKVWTGPAVIARNPCLHPGDLRKVKAVNVRELSHLKNCVVFSQKGYKPLPNLLAGGDLDGDEYFVCFDERLFIPENEKPMDYDPPKRKTLERPVEIDDICEFFTDFMLNDRLGQIDNLHLAHADSNSKGVKSLGCMHLAELHSKAVDFNKTGVPVLDDLPNAGEYPDFMEIKCKDSYKSEKVLGKLYRNIKLYEYESDPILKYKNVIFPNNDFLFDGYQNYMEEAVVCRDRYNSEIRNLMRNYRVNTEAEIITAELLSIRQMDGRKSQNTRELISESVSFIIHNFRKQFLVGIQDIDSNLNDTYDAITPFNLYVPIPVNDNSKAKASAWYYITYNYPEEGNKIGLLSFPWIVSDILLSIRKDKHRTN
ncbi:RNA dependent RNA polymerase-domain-containing protein [Glomus cerebriforme]|uniref:RNA-dependent RNA polymerase n=1 Tax=Glomus cerebriforme TaxID=658196 RepID=A0A397THF3_9GLOM|nr:RNA dependent RNA polymerase-domain-containing protein [Glomus cerebriforme]